MADHRGSALLMKRRPPPKKRDPIAPSLADKLFRQRRVPSKKKYDRKKEKNSDSEN